MGRRITLVGAPFDLGAPRRGSRLGPAALRLAGLAEALEEAGLSVEDAGDVVVEAGPVEVDGKVKNLAAVAGTCGALRDRVAEILGAGRLPVILGGDHSVAMGAIAGSVQHHRQQGDELGLLWFDAHDDMNTPETGQTGNLHGMALAVALGLGEPSLVELAGPGPMIQGRHAAALGLRVIGAPQVGNIRASGLGMSTRDHFDRNGVPALVENALSRALAGTRGLHVSFDLDVVDPALAPGVGSPSPGGLSWSQARMALQQVGATGRVVSVDFVELDPTLDRQNVSARLAVDLIVALLAVKGAS